MSNNSRLLFLFIALIGIAGLSYVIFFDENTDQQTDVQVVNEIESTTTTLIDSTTSTSTTTIMETTTTSTTTTSSTTTTTIPPNQTAIYATQEEINNSKKISYDFLQSGCKKDESTDSEKEWITPLEFFTYDESKINFSLKIDSTLGLKVDCIGNLITSILNDTRGWVKVTEKEFQLIEGTEKEFEFIFASPEKTDELCYPLETNGIYSCRNEDQIIINYFRWLMVR